MARKIEAGKPVEVNMTPMIDMTFQLIIFFILTSQFASAALAQLELHEPWRSEAQAREETGVSDRVIVNVLSVASTDSSKRDPRWSGQLAHYEVVGKELKEGELLKVMRDAKRSAVAAGLPPEKFLVEIRADKDVEFHYVKPVMDIAAEAKIGTVEVTAKRPE